MRPSHWSLACLFLFVSQAAWTQVREVNISALFKNPKKIQWVRHYQGRVDDINDVSLTLGYDGKYCKGFATYLRSKEAFGLEGTLSEGRLELRETNREGVVSGHFEGDVSADFAHIEAQWFNREHSRAESVTLEVVDKQEERPGCGDDKWVRQYKGFTKRDSLTVLLQRNSEKDLRGVVCFHQSGRTLSLRGILENGVKIQLGIIDDLDQQLGEINGTMNAQNLSITGVWKDVEGDSHRLFLRNKSDMVVDCVEYQDYMITYDAIFPKSQHTAFNKFIDKAVAQWRDGCRDYALRLKRENPNPGPDKRAIASAAGWYGVDYISEDFISGHLTFDRSWEDGYTDISYNYDLVNDRLFTLADIFLPNTDFHTILRENAMKRLKYTSLYGDPNYKSWLDKADFPHFSIREDGIRYSTEFNVVYGRQSVTIPFREIEQYLREDSPISHLFVRTGHASNGKRHRK